MKRLFYYFIITVLINTNTCYLSYAQESNNTDSLELLLKKETLDDSSKIQILNGLCRELMSTKPLVALEHGQAALVLAKKHQLSLQIGHSLSNIGTTLRKLGKYKEALHHYEEALGIHENAMNKKDLAKDLHNIASIYQDQGIYDKAIEFYIKSLKIKEIIVDGTNDKTVKQGIANSLNNIGFIYLNQQNFKGAMQYYKEALITNESLVNAYPNDPNTKSELGQSYINIGQAHFYQKDYKLAIEQFREAQILYRKIDNKRGLAYCLNNIGGVYFYQGKFDEALVSFLDAVEVLKELEDQQNVAIGLLNISEIYTKLQNYYEGESFARQSLKIAREIGYKDGVKGAYESIADILAKQKKYEEAFAYHQKYTNVKDSLLNEKSSEQIAQMQTIYETEKKEKEIELLSKDKVIQEAINNRQRIVIYASIGGITLLIALAFFIFRSYKQKKKANALLNEQNIEITLQKEELAKLSVVAEKTDSGVMISDNKGIIEWVNTGFNRLTGYTMDEFKEKFGNTLTDISSHSGMEQILKFVIMKKRSHSYDSPHIHKDGTERWTSATITPVFEESGELKKIVTVYSDISAVKKAEEALQEKNEDITDSIRYAERIQAAILPSDREFNRLLPSAFIHFKPKDIVSGDFYWMSEKEDRVLYLTADCTGHGVPGAFMSMINTSLLNEVVNENGITQPSEIFYEVRKGLVKAMKQTGEMGEQKDGMDAVLCALLKENGSDKFTKLECAAANNSILVIRKGDNPLMDNKEAMTPILEEEEGDGKMYEIKADRQPVGYKSEEMTPYTHHSVDLLPGDLIYTFSDGYQDQFGGPKGRKFMIKRQKHLLMDIYMKPLQKQKEILIKKMEKWQTNPKQPDGYSEQIDDIIFIGVLV